MAKWWDERADYYRELSQNRNYSPAPARQPAPAPPTTASEWMRERERERARAVPRYEWVNTQVVNDWGMDSVSTTNLTSNWLRDDYVNQLRHEIQRSSTTSIFQHRFSDINPTMDAAREVNETWWDASPDSYPRMVIGRVNPRDPQRVQYTHLTGRLSRVDTLRALARYWATRERVNLLFDNGSIDILHPDATQCRWSTIVPMTIDTRSWDGGTKNQTILQWADGKWHKRSPDNQLWMPIDPEKPE